MRERWYVLAVLVLAAAMFVGLRAFLRGEQAASVSRLTELAAESRPTGGPATRPIAETARLLREMKVVTVEVRTRVESSRLDESWRGDVRASVTAPARLLYGCDLSGIGESGGGASIRPSLLTGGYVLRVPRPARIAAEIEGRGGDEQADVRVGWGRFRDLAGEYQLGLARTGLQANARGLVLTAAQREEVERTTREQLTVLVRALGAGGEGVPVSVEFFEVGDGQVAGAEGER